MDSVGQRTESRPDVLEAVSLFIDRRFFVLAVLPAFLVVFGVTVVPFLSAFGLSFTDYTLTHPNVLNFTGLENYQLMLEDPSVPQVVETTLIYTFGSVAAETIVGMGLALLLALPFRGVGIYRTLYMMPLLTASIVTAITWRALFNTNSGWINYFLGLMGLPQPDWLNNPVTALPAVIIADMWVGAPFMAILILAALLNTPHEPVEAAKVDGASALQSFRFITLPAIMPVLTIALIFRAVEAFRQFGLFQVMTGGGPGIQTTVLNYYIYQNSFSFEQIGYGSALSVLLIGMMAVAMGAIFFAGARFRQ